MAKEYTFEGKTLKIVVRTYHPEVGGHHTNTGGCHVFAINKNTGENLLGDIGQEKLFLEDSIQNPSIAVRNFIKILKLYER